ncbi:MAG: helix-turn-helix domain-containing protein [Pseudonocardiaceae bacterium]
MTAPRNPHRARLAARLRALRAAVGLSGNRLAQQLGWPQPRVSKLETGRQIPTKDDLDAWLTATGAGPEQATELAELLSAARIEYATWRGVQRSAGGLAARHAERATWETATTHIAEYQPTLIPGLVQTTAYARALLTSPLATAMNITEADADALVAARVKRQDILYQPARTIEIMLGEAALWTIPSTVGILLGQLDRLLSFAELPSLTLGLVPHDAPMPIPPLTCFGIYDHEFVLIETLTGEQRLDDPDEVAVYRTAFGQLRNAATTGPDAIALIRRVMAELRG